MAEFSERLLRSFKAQYLLSQVAYSELEAYYGRLLSTAGQTIVVVTCASDRIYFIIESDIGPGLSK